MEYRLLSNQTGRPPNAVPTFDNNSNNHLQTGWGMSTSLTAILADFDNNATNYHHPW